MHAPVRDDLYGAWLDAIRSLGEQPQGTQPAFMATPAFRDLRLDSALAAYGQLRHNNVLITAQMYNQGGCEIPDGYVDPAPAVYAALARWAKQGDKMFATLDPKGKTGGAAYFQRAGRVLGVLTKIARDELAGRPLSPDEKRFLAMVVEMREASAWNYNGTFPVPTYDGWYLDLFPDTDIAFHDASFIADYGTHDVNDVRWVDYLGAKGPQLGLFVVDVGGTSRLMAGPVAQAYAATGPVAKRFTDETASQATAVMPWAASYTVAAPHAPKLTVDFATQAPKPSLERVGPGRGRRDPQLPLDTIVLQALEAGDVTIELRDHHFVKLDSFVVHAGVGETRAKIPDEAIAARIESILVRVGDFEGRVDLDLERVAHGQFGE